MEEQLSLDNHAQLALEVAKHAALANGDSRCGTEYLLYGLVATAHGEIVELIELFALNTLRIDRAIERLLELRPDDLASFAEPKFTSRAIDALQTPHLDGGPTGLFELMHGLLVDDQSGACAVLRDLGVQANEARRLVAYGMRHLSREEIDDLLTTLDRRNGGHRGWWGPDPAGRIDAIRTPGLVPLYVASSDSARVELTAFGTDGFGFGFTMSIRSLRTWVLPPVFAPEEALIPGVGAHYNAGPDFLLLQVALPDGTTLDNRAVFDRFVFEQPEAPRLLSLGQRDEHINLNDRRHEDQHVITGDWWVWPQPEIGAMEIHVDWPAESVSGSVSLDGSVLKTGR
ncbi:MAG: hypothetical protein ACI81L_002039 [Verrucomicrobiales bacterium]|jgi:hypothetical protein